MDGYDKDKIVICPQCGKPEYWGEVRKQKDRVYPYYPWAVYRIDGHGEGQANGKD